MKFLNLGLQEILFIFIISIIIFGPNSIVKSAKDIGTLIRRTKKSPYWKEVWATKRDLDELPKMLAKEAELGKTIHESDQESRNISGAVTSSVKELITEANEATKIILPNQQNIDLANSADQTETILGSKKDTENQKLAP